MEGAKKGVMCLKMLDTKTVDRRICLCTILLLLLPVMIVLFHKRKLGMRDAFFRA